ncbi:uncharacterized protein DS421_12g374390 [Arachis hypogaea]|nr:uncharacterized protein DS421_12g374390 [Arachis hypogaea]
MKIKKKDWWDNNINEAQKEIKAEKSKRAKQIITRSKSDLILASKPLSFALPKATFTFVPWSEIRKSERESFFPKLVIKEARKRKIKLERQMTNQQVQTNSSLIKD